MINGSVINIKWGKKNNLGLSNFVSPSIFDKFCHVYVNIPTDKNKKQIIDKVSKIISEVFIIIIFRKET